MGWKNKFFTLFVGFILVCLSFLLFLLPFLLSENVTISTKVSSFECGFLGVGKAQTAFSVHFFLIILLFVVFDLEIVLLTGLLLSTTEGFYTLIFLWFFVLGGLYLEWAFGKLSWLVYQLLVVNHYKCLVLNFLSPFLLFSLDSNVV